MAYLVRPGWLSAVTILPAWVWAIPGLFLVLVSHRRRCGKRTALLLLPWVLFVVFMTEEPKALFTQCREWPSRAWLAAKEEGRAFRVISLNCKRETLPLQEAVSYEPDLLLLQETPPGREVKNALFGHPEYTVALGSRVSILAKGTIRELPVEPEDQPHIKMAEVQLGECHLVATSVHLVPASRDPDLLDSRTWAIAQGSHGIRATQVLLLMHYVKKVDKDIPQLIGGDFNSTAGDSVLRPLSARFNDSFRLAGVGLGNTVRPHLPLLRVDYIWTDDHLTPHGVVARNAAGSDHRMVICDVALGAR